MHNPSIILYSDCPYWRHVKFSGKTTILLVPVHSLLESLCNSEPLPSDRAARTLTLRTVHATRTRVVSSSVPQFDPRFRCAIRLSPRKPALQAFIPQPGKSFALDPIRRISGVASCDKAVILSHLPKSNGAYVQRRIPALSRPRFLRVCILPAADPFYRLSPTLLCFTSHRPARGPSVLAAKAMFGAPKGASARALAPRRGSVGAAESARLHIPPAVTAADSLRAILPPGRSPRLGRGFGLTPTLLHDFLRPPSSIFRRVELNIHSHKRELVTAFLPSPYAVIFTFITLLVKVSPP
ncbi:hypothetical protein B0H17DRAFT_1206047 [Mycena rosella]|uniref:Uncharacterized protein n=1 Tax=Mycena rosella TaxID=1033263 RepID=A0AAD7D9G4_MYCRO|nr:hypothetical protein B0H17DRAFT_1206047 [Mycena rosella]